MNWHDLFVYNSGHLLWKAGQNNNVVAGAKAGYLRGGYLQVMVDGKTYGAHCIIWEMHNGPIPDGMFIDHEDRIRSNNLLSNLRLVTRKVNNQNKGMQCNNTSGVTGVTLTKQAKPWTAQIRVDGKRVHLGSFADKDAAIAARKHAEAMYGFHPSHGQ